MVDAPAQMVLLPVIPVGDAGVAALLVTPATHKRAFAIKRPPSVVACQKSLRTVLEGG